MRPALLILLALSGCPAPPVPVAPGHPCSPPDAPGCDEGAPRLLRCASGTWAVYSDCHGPDGCAPAGDSLTCDTSGNTLGDRCAPTGEGKIRCQPDGGLRILQCTDGGLVSLYECPSGASCVGVDGGLSCR